MKRAREEDIELTANDDVDNKNNKKPRILDEETTQLISQKSSSSSRLAPILNEDIIDDQILDDMDDIAERGDLRKLFNIKTGNKIEIKWELTYDEETDEEQNGIYWLEANIHDSEQTETYRFYENDDGTGDYQDVPIVLIKYNDDDTAYKVVFAGEHTLFDVESKEIVPWRHYGDDYDGSISDDDSDTDDDEDNDYRFEFSNEEEIKRCVEKIVPEIFVNILEKYKTMFDNLPYKQQRDWTAVIMTFKEKLVQKMVSFFVEKMNKDATDKQVIELKPDDIDKMMQTVMDEMDDMN